MIEQYNIFYHRSPRTIEELETYIYDEWENIPEYTIRNLVSSVNDRMNMFIEAEGNISKH